MRPGGHRLRRRCGVRGRAALWRTRGSGQHHRGHREAGRVRTSRVGAGLRHGQYPVARRRAGRRRAPVLAASSGWGRRAHHSGRGAAGMRSAAPASHCQHPDTQLQRGTRGLLGEGRFLASHPGPRTGPRPNSRHSRRHQHRAGGIHPRCLVCEHEWTVQLELCSRRPQWKPRPVRTALSSLVLPARCCARNPGA